MQDAVLGLALATLLFLLAAGVAVMRSPRRRGFRGSNPSYRYDRYQWPDLTDPAQQLHFVMAASFEKQKVLNRDEYRIFRIVEHEVRAARKGHRVLAQINLGEILRTRVSNAFRSINSKRVDIIVIDWAGFPILAIEHLGKGHFQGKAAARDAVKKEALRKAGVRYLEFGNADRDEQIRFRVREQLGWNTATPANEQGSARASAVPAQ